MAFLPVRWSLHEDLLEIHHLRSMRRRMREQEGVSCPFAHVSISHADAVSRGHEVEMTLHLNDKAAPTGMHEIIGWYPARNPNEELLRYLEGRVGIHEQAEVRS